MLFITPVNTVHILILAKCYLNLLINTIILILFTTIFQTHLNPVRVVPELSHENNMLSCDMWFDGKMGAVTSCEVGMFKILFNYLKDLNEFRTLDNFIYLCNWSFETWSTKSCGCLHFTCLAICVQLDIQTTVLYNISINFCVLANQNHGHSRVMLEYHIYPTMYMFILACPFILTSKRELLSDLVG